MGEAGRLIFRQGSLVRIQYRPPQFPPENQRGSTACALGLRLTQIMLFDIKVGNESTFGSILEEGLGFLS